MTAPRPPQIAELPTRQRIFQTALDLLRAGGTETATLRAICQDANITPPTLYHHFGDMKGLYREVVEHIVDQMRGRQSPAAEFTPRDWIEDTWAIHIRMAQTEPGLFDLWARHIAWDRMSPSELQPYRSLVRAFQSLAVEHPLKVPAKSAAYMFWSAAHGMACIIAASRHSGVPYARGAAETLKAIVLDGIFERSPF